MGKLKSSCSFKKYRIVKPAQYKFLFNKPKRVINNHFIIIAKKNKENYSRLGLVISKKSIKLSVQRNRIKRLVKEYFRTEITCGNHAIDFVVIAKKDINIKSNKQLLISLNRNFRKLISQLY